LRMSDAPSTAGRWPERLPVSSFRVMRPRRNYDRTIPFYRDLIGLPVLETFQASYGEDGTIFGLPDSSTHLEIVRAREPAGPVSQFDQLVFYQTDEGAQQDVIASLAGHGVQPASEQHPYWEANGGVTYRDPGARGVVFASWVTDAMSNLPPTRAESGESAPRPSRAGAEEGGAVVSTSNRNTGTHQPASTRQASTGQHRRPCRALARDLPETALHATSRCPTP
jgi:hypothetical protein